MSVVSAPHLALLCLSLVPGLCRGEETPTAKNDLARTMAITAEVAQEAAGHSVVIGAEGWLFLREEVRHLGVGPFWAEHAQQASERSSDQDPLAAIVDFHNQLEALGIELLVVPVPPRAAVYPELLDARLGPDAAVALSGFHDELRMRGVRSLDLLSLFRAAREQDAQAGQLYCRSDSHWSPRGMSLAAAAIAEAIGEPSWRQEALPLRSERQREQISFQGDLVQLSGLMMDDETHTIEKIIDLSTGAAPATDPASPVLLLADSHGLVFSAGQDMHATGAGLREHVAAELGMAIDAIAIRGSAATGVRVQLARRFHRDEDYRAQKKIVTWVFAGRSLSEATDGWKVFSVAPR